MASNSRERGGGGGGMTFTNKHLRDFAAFFRNDFRMCPFDDKLGGKKVP
jgi:hypothetical protein